MDPELRKRLKDYIDGSKIILATVCRVIREDRKDLDIFAPKIKNLALSIIKARKMLKEGKYVPDRTD